MVIDVLQSEPDSWPRLASHARAAALGYHKAFFFFCFSIQVQFITRLTVLLDPQLTSSGDKYKRCTLVPLPDSLTAEGIIFLEFCRHGWRHALVD